MNDRTPGPWQIDRFLGCVVGTKGQPIGGEADLTLVAAAPDLLAVLQRYVNAYPAFRIKPIGAPGSEKRIEQENLMALEDAARTAIAKAIKTSYPESETK